MLLASFAMAQSSPDALVKTVIEGATTDAERAKRLYDAAMLAEKQQATQIALLEKAAEYGLRSASVAAARETAEKALDLLAQKTGDKAAGRMGQFVRSYRSLYERCKARKDRERVGGKLVDLLLKAGAAHQADGDWAQTATSYREANAIASYLGLPNEAEIAREYQRADHILHVRQRVARWIDVLKKNADNTPARVALLKAVVVDLDDPAAAAKYLTPEVGEKWCTYVPLAARPVSEIQAKACEELGNWYDQELAGNCASVSRRPMLRRAKSYYDRCLKLDPSSLAAKVVLRRIERELDKPQGFEPLKGAILVMTFDQNTIRRAGGHTWVKDLSGGGNHGKIARARLVEGKVGQCLSFDEDAHVLLPTLRDNLARSKAVTLCAWVKKTAPAAGNSFLFDVGFYAGSSLTLLADARLQVPGTGSPLQADCSGPGWHHIAGVWDGKEATLLVDGVPQAGKPLPGGSLAKVGKETARIGCQAKRVQTAGRYMSGLIDEFAIFARALSAGEIRELYRRGQEGKGLLAKP